MPTVSKNQIETCTGEMRCIYTFNDGLKKQFIDRMSSLGNVKRVNVGKGAILLIESGNGFRLIVNQRRNEIDARFKRSDYPDNLNRFENKVTQFCPAINFKES